MKLIDSYMSHSDERGVIRGITQDAWHEANYVETSAGTTRGGHYHKETLELFYIIDGEVEILVKNVNTGAEDSIIVTAGAIVLIEPYELHTFKVNLPTRWINMLSIKHKPDSPDFYN